MEISRTIQKKSRQGSLPLCGGGEWRDFFEGGVYESFGGLGAYRRRLKAARGAHQTLTWLARLMQVNERIEAYHKAYDQRFWKRLERMDGLKVMR